MPEAGGGRMGAPGGRRSGGPARTPAEAHDGPPGNGPPPRPVSRWAWALFFQHRPLEHESAVFLLVNLADVVATAWLVHSGRFREANWVAVWVLRQWGWHGLLAYKFGLVAVVCLLAQAIARRRPETARQLLTGASVLFALVVLAALALAAAG